MIDLSEPQTIATGTAKIVEALLARFQPECIYLFGSRARGDNRPDSDCDIYMEVDSKNWPEEESHSRNGVLFGFHDAEVHVRVPGWLALNKDEPGLIMYDVAREGILLYHVPGYQTVVPSDPPRRVRENRKLTRKRAEWLRLARLDFDLVAHLSDDIARWKEPICFHAQQSAEKFLKALAMTNRHAPPYTHDLEVLLAFARSHDFSLGGIDRRCRRLKPFAVEGRYPFEELPAFPTRRAISTDHAIRAIEDATAIKLAVERELP